MKKVLLYGLLACGMMITPVGGMGQEQVPAVTTPKPPIEKVWWHGGYRPYYYYNYPYYGYNYGYSPYYHHRGWGGPFLWGWRVV